MSKRFKVGDMAKLIRVGLIPQLRPYLGTVCDVIESPGRCYCIFCLLENNLRPSESDYRIALCDGNSCLVMDEQLAPITDPDAGRSTIEDNELEIVR
jgi:hypothetical protein